MVATVELSTFLETCMQNTQRLLYFIGRCQWIKFEDLTGWVL